MDAELNNLIVEQADKIAGAIGGPEKYRRSLTDTSVMRDQWNALRQDGWHQMLAVGADEASSSNTLTLCRVAERFGFHLIAAPISNLAVANRFVAPHVGLDSVPIIALNTRGTVVTEFVDVSHIAVVAYPQTDIVNVHEFVSADFVVNDYPHGPMLMRSVAKQETMSIVARAIWVPLLLSAAAELVGVASAALDLAVEHIKVRNQFGRPLGSFQAVQHRAADDAIAVAETRAIVYQTANSSGDAAHSRHLACAALSKALDTAIQVTSSSIQMFGAIGFTAEHDVGLFLKRAMHIQRIFGPASLYRSYFTSEVRPAELEGAA